MNVAHRAPPPVTMRGQAEALPVLTGNFVLLRADRLQLLLPQEDLGVAGHLDRPPRDSGELGLFELDGEDDDPPCLVAALSSRMALLERFPAGRFLLTGFACQDGIQLAWDDARVLLDVRLQPQALPAAMTAPGAPLREYVELGEQLAFCCTGERLLAHAFAAGR